MENDFLTMFFFCESGFFLPVMVWVDFNVTLNEMLYFFSISVGCFNVGYFMLFV